MANKTTITICTGVGMNMFFPEYKTITIDLPKPRKSLEWMDQLEAPEVEKPTRKRKAK